MLNRPLLALALCAGLSLFAPAPARADELWSRDLEGAFKQARESGRLVLVEFYAPCTSVGALGIRSSLC